MPEDSDFPYVVILVDMVQPIYTTTTEGSQITFTVHGFSQAAGTAECYSILQKVHETLQDAAPTIPGYSMVNLRYTGSQFELLSDGITTHGSISFRSHIQRN